MLNKFLVQRPFITEKGTLFGTQGKYVFLVDGKANKSEIKKILEKEHSVHITRINIINAQPKERRQRGRVRIKPGFKKAIITLKKGEKLDIVPQ